MHLQHTEGLSHNKYWWKLKQEDHYLNASLYIQRPFASETKQKTKTNSNIKIKTQREKEVSLKEDEYFLTHQHGSVTGLIVIV